MKHAYMILAHKNPNQIKTLLECLDHQNNDIFIHIDKKNTDIIPDDIRKCIHKSNLYFTNRISVAWADYTIVEATYILLKAAVKNGPYIYYHLISGQDMPLKSISEINSFYESNDCNINYVSFHQGNHIPSELKKRIHARKFFFHGGRYVRKIYDKFLSEKDLSKLPYGKGDAWFDITDALAKLLIENETWAKSVFKDYLFPDESFIQTLININKLNDTCYSNGVMRKVNWEKSIGGASPNIYCIEDYDYLINSGMHFARKFDEKIDNNIILKLKEHALEI